MVDTAMTHTTDTGAQEVVVQEWTFERIQEAVKKVAHNVPPYKGTQAVTAFQAEQLMGMVRNELQQTIATLTALPKELSDSIIRRDATIATQAARIAELEETLQFAAKYKGYEARACPLCKYEHGKFIEHCQMHKDMRAQGQRITGLETELDNCVAQNSKLVLAGQQKDAQLESERRAHLVADATLTGDLELARDRIAELESAIVIDRGVFNRLCVLQAIMAHPTATPTAEEFDEYTGLLEFVFHTHDEGDDDDI